MCGRFDQDRSNAQIDALVRQLGATGPEEVFPGAEAIVLLDGERPASMPWGFPRQQGKGLIFNVRSESAREKFGGAVCTRPLVAPATGFYEWRGAKGHKEKLFFQAPCLPGSQATQQAPLLYLAGFWRLFADIPRFTILTRAANDFMRPFHHRMPLLLPPEHIGAWLGGKEPEAFWQLPSPSLIAKTEESAARSMQGVLQ